jgi:hypothetical protein
MKVSDLIDLLKDFDPELEVHFTYTASDDLCTELAPAVHSVGDGIVKHNSYYRMDELLDEDEMQEDEGDYEDTRRVVVIG